MQGCQPVRNFRICTDFTCKIREYEFGLQNTEIELCQFCHIKYCCQNKAYLFWVANQSRFVVFHALKPSNTSLITKTFILLSSTCGSNTCSSSLPVPVVPKESTRVSTGSQWVPPEEIGSCHNDCFESDEEQIKGYGKVIKNTEIFSTKYRKHILEVGSPADVSDWWLRYLLWNCPNMNVTGHHRWSVNIGSGNGLLPSSNNPLPEPMLTQISVVTWHH